MPCYFPTSGFTRVGGGHTTSRSLARDFKPLLVPCGQCIGCRLDRVRDWSVRCVHEAKLHDETSFLTVTYSDQFLPDGGTLVPRHLSLFLKRLRKRVWPRRVRFYACGEYGEINERPHYHVLLFGLWPSDCVPFRKSQSGHVLFQSSMLDAVWGQGDVLIGRATRQSAAYVARYCLKKVSGSAADGHYAGRFPEFARMSTRPGIGYGWLQRYETDAFPSAFVVIDGKKYPVPRYYKGKLRDRYEYATSSRLLERDDLEQTRETLARYAETPEFRKQNTEVRLLEREELALLKQSRIKRV